MEFENRKLYGGAIAMDVPAKYYDVSDVRQVPDTQEVFQEREGIHSLIVDLLEHVEQVEDPVEAARYHLDDCVDGIETATVWHTENVKVSLPRDVASAARLLATPEPKNGKTTAVFLLLLRLPKHATDIVITANMHGVSVGNASDYDALFSESADPAFADGRALLQQAIDTFEIKDSGLFHPA